MASPIEFYGVPSMQALIYHKIFIDVQPLDTWDEWVYAIILEDSMCPFFELCKSDAEKPFKTYHAAFSFALNILEQERIIEVIELPF